MCSFMLDAGRLHGVFDCDWLAHTHLRNHTHPPAVTQHTFVLFFCYCCIFTQLNSLPQWRKKEHMLVLLNNNTLLFITWWCHQIASKHHSSRLTCFSRVVSVIYPCSRTSQYKLAIMWKFHNVVYRYRLIFIDIGWYRYQKPESFFLLLSKYRTSLLWRVSARQLCVAHHFITVKLQ